MGQDSTVVTVISNTQDQEPPDSEEACLVVINGVDLGKKYSLVQSSTLIGRSSKVDIQINEESISRNHAIIENENGEFALRDLESTNGTYVNDRPVREHVLQDGDKIKIGSTILKFLSGNNIESAYHDEIYQLTTTDGLTGAHNKRYFLKEMEREMSRSIRYDRNLSLVMCDIDYFKETNDTYGHLAGDHVLKQVAQSISEHIRRDDIFARYGGEEFMLLLPELSKSEAMTMADKLRGLIESTEFVFDNTAIPVTISAGVAELSEYLERHASSDPEEQSRNIDCLNFIQIVDDRLYDAKESGRNCVRG
jgi:diguanylate cyclase (GGDEF)-like protein